MFLFGCQSQKENLKSNPTNELKKKESVCPDNGSCSLEIITNKQMEVKSDAFAALYPKFSAGKTTLIKFEYKKKSSPNIADDQYSEVIYLELPATITNLSLKDDALQQVKLLHGRLCFCRGATGYYKITNGALQITHLENNSYLINLQFKNDQVPQLITELNETIVINQN